MGNTLTFHHSLCEEHKSFEAQFERETSRGFFNDHPTWGFLYKISFILPIKTYSKLR